MSEKLVTYNLDFPHHEAPPSQEQFQELMTTLSVFDLSFAEFLNVLNDYYVCERIATGNWD